MAEIGTSLDRCQPTPVLRLVGIPGPSSSLLSQLPPQLRLQEHSAQTEGLQASLSIATQEGTGRKGKEGLFFRKRPGAHACPQCSAESVACFTPHLTVGPSLRPPPWSRFLGPSWRVLHATLRVPPAELGHGSCRAGLSLPRNHQICAASSFSFPPPPPLFHLQDKQT